MRHSWAVRWSVLSKIACQPIFNIPAFFAAFWGVSGHYDLFSAQWAPEFMRPFLKPVSDMLPDAWETVSWWIFILLLAVSVIGIFEFAVKQEKKIRAVDWRERLQHNGKWDLAIYRFAPIKWSGFDHFLSRTMFSKDLDRPPSVSAFRLHGTNLSKTRPIHFKGAYLRAMVHSKNMAGDEKIDAWIEGIEKRNDVIIDPDTEFTVIAQFNAMDGDANGPTVQEFRQRFSFFKFVFLTDRGNFEQEFGIDDVDELLIPVALNFECGAAQARKSFSTYEGKSREPQTGARAPYSAANPV